MSSTKTESPITKVIFLQKIFRFAGRTLKDHVFINYVCQDFEETMQAHHTFNLVLYDNIIKKRKDEKMFLYRSERFLYKAPAWIVYQWTVVNEHDETQRELLKDFLLYQAETGNDILLREPSLIRNEEDPSTTHELLCHMLDSCAKLGIAKEVLEASTFAENFITHAIKRKISAGSLTFLIEFCAQHGIDVKKILEQKDIDNFNSIMIAAIRQLPADLFKLLIESCVQHGVDMKMILVQESRSGWNSIMLAVAHRCPIDFSKLLIESCARYGVDMKMMLEQKDRDNYNCIMIATNKQLPIDSLALLIESCVQHGVDMTTMLEQKDANNFNCLMVAAQHELNADSFKLLIAHFPSNESFRKTLAAESWEKKRAVEYATTDEIKAFLEDQDCWQKCREWCTSNGITLRRGGQESGSRRERK